jgi:Tfp pilus assembly protein PilW
MKVSCAGHWWARGRLWVQKGMTLCEVLIASTVFIFVVTALVYCQMFGLRQDQLVNSQLGASDNSRTAFDDLLRDIRQSQTWQIGNGSFSTFTTLTNGTYWQGNALQICFSTNTSVYIRYYFDTNKCQLCRFHSGDAATTVLAKNLTNSMYFVVEDYRGKTNSFIVDTNSATTYKAVVHTVMQFCEYQYPLTKVGPGYFYDYYRLDLRAARHAPNFP